MKILYVSAGKGEDYQRDVLFHGLRELLGADAVDAHRIDSLYAQSDQAKYAMYGRGYTVYATLPDIAVDREGVEEKIRSRHFDLIIYGSIHRCDQYLEQVQQCYPPSRIVFVDGEDQARLKWAVLGKGIYFKRELLQPLFPVLHPVHFAVPTVKFISDAAFVENLQRKQRLMASCDPRDRSTYVFFTEPDYYLQYQQAYYGITMKKLGWDCMRHHEIVSQGTAPYFIGLEHCPEWTLSGMPKKQFLELRSLVSPGMTALPPDLHSRYAGLMREVFHIYQRSFTTRALAEQVLDAVARSSDIDRVRPGSAEIWGRKLRAWLHDRFAI